MACSSSLGRTWGCPWRRSLSEEHSLWWPAVDCVVQSQASCLSFSVSIVLAENGAIDAHLVELFLKMKWNQLCQVLSACWHMTHTPVIAVILWLQKRSATNRYLTLAQSCHVGGWALDFLSIKCEILGCTPSCSGNWWVFEAPLKSWWTLRVFSVLGSEQSCPSSG